MQPYDLPTNRAATVLAVKGCDRARKWLYLLNLSTTTRMVSKPLEEGRPTKKSREMSSQIRLGIGRGAIDNLEPKFHIYVVDRPSNFGRTA